MPGLLSSQDVPQVALEGDSRVRQAVWHANIAVRGDLTPTNMRWLEALLRRSPVEPEVVDADAQLIVLTKTRSRARWRAAVAAHGSHLLKLLGCLDDELLSTRHLMPCAHLVETRVEARLHVVPERLPRDVG